MIGFRETGARYSAIVGIGEKIKRMEAETGKKYLPLNRGVTMVTHIDLEPVVSQVDFNSGLIQLYPPNSGLPGLKKAINGSYFAGRTREENLFIVNGGMSGLDILFKTLDVKKIFTYQFYWGAYINIMKINNIQHDVYRDFRHIRERIDEIRGQALIICDPNNPVGNKFPDEVLIDIIRYLDENNVVVIFDSPYRKLFVEDDFYARLLEFDRLVILDSFSKSVGLSGQRIGFIHSIDEKFNQQLNINVLYSTNGINAFSQVLIEKLLSTPEGKASMDSFKKTTTEHIALNMEYLARKGLLAEEFYTDSKPVGIFAIIKPDPETLLQHRIGSVPMNFFTKNQEIIERKYSRVCVSVNHESLVEYFEAMAGR